MAEVSIPSFSLGPPLLPTPGLVSGSGVPQTTDQSSGPAETIITHYNIDRKLLAQGRFITLRSQYTRFKYIEGIKALWLADVNKPPVLETITHWDIITCFMSKYMFHLFVSSV